jgi:hypothetical protein
MYYRKALPIAWLGLLTLCLSLYVGSFAGLHFSYTSRWSELYNLADVLFVAATFGLWSIVTAKQHHGRLAVVAVVAAAGASTLWLAFAVWLSLRTL